MNLLFLFIGLIIGSLGITLWLNKKILVIRNNASEKEKQFLLQQAETDRQKSIVNETLRLKSEENAWQQKELETARITIAGQGEQVARITTENFQQARHDGD